MKPVDHHKDPIADIFEEAFARRFLSEMADRYGDEIDSFSCRRSLGIDRCLRYFDAECSARPAAEPEDETDSIDDKI